LRSKPVFVVAQKSQPIAQPTCDETHPAALSGRKSGIKTDSTVFPSPSLRRSFVVPSPDTALEATPASLRTLFSARSSARAVGRGRPFAAGWFPAA